MLFKSKAKKTNKRKRKYILHIHNIVRVVKSQKLLANKHNRLRDSRLSLVWPSGGLGLVIKQRKKKPQVDYEPCSAHGRARVNKILSYVDASICLGVVIDSKLSWQPQITAVCKLNI